MTKSEMFEKLWKQALELQKNYTFDAYKKIWDDCCEWNDKNPDDEIFMCDHCDDNNKIDGFCIEDDCIILED